MKWPMLPVREVADVITKGTTPTTMGRPFTESGVTFVKAEALNGDTSLDPQGFSFIDQATHDLLKRSILQEHDVLVTIAGAHIGKCGYVTAEYLPANTNQAVGIVRVNQGKALPRFVYYSFKQPATFRLIQSLGAQAAQPNLNLAMLGSLKIPVPTIETQKGVTQILASYDSLVETNRRRIALLEAAVRLLFREWFVFFRFPGHEHVPIIRGAPESWEQHPLVEVVEVNPTTPVNKNRNVIYLPMAGLSTVGMSVNCEHLAERPEATTVHFKNGDTLFARITPCLENGKTGYVDFLPEGEAACGSTEFIVLRGRLLSSFFVYCLARTERLRGIAIKSMIGSSGRQRVQESCFDEFMVPLPPKDLLDSFDDFAAPAFRQIRELTAANERLRNARDLLLPKLMSGEVEV